MQTILCATSGDTGGAAVEAFRGRKNVKVVALFPEGRISEVQRRFMTTAAEANVACVAVKGTFDDCQAIVKQAFQDQALRQAVDLSGVNSINFARIAAQAVYYFTTAAALGAPQRPVSFCVPRAISATPSPATSPTAWACRSAGSWWPPTPTTSWPAPSRPAATRAARCKPTMSPAMDIQSASNFERLYFESVGRDADGDGAGLRRPSPTTGAIEVPPARLRRHARALPRRGGRARPRPRRPSPRPSTRPAS